MCCVHRRSLGGPGPAQQLRLEGDTHQMPGVRHIWEPLNWPPPPAPLRVAVCLLLTAFEKLAAPLVPALGASWWPEATHWVPGRKGQPPASAALFCPGAAGETLLPPPGGDERCWRCPSEQAALSAPGSWLEATSHPRPLHLLEQTIGRRTPLSGPLSS